MKKQTQALVITDDDCDLTEVVPFDGFPVYTRTLGWADSQEDLDDVCETYCYSNEFIGQFNADERIMTYTRRIKNFLVAKVIKPSVQTQIVDLFDSTQPDSKRTSVSTTVLSTAHEREDPCEEFEIDWDPTSGESKLYFEEDTQFEHLKAEIIQIGEEQNDQEGEQE